jgi:hypothetical protein
LAAEKDSLAQEVCKLRDELAERQVTIAPKLIKYE